MSSNRLLVTGLTGFVGQALHKYFESAGSDFGITLCDVVEPYDLLDPVSLSKLLHDHQPDWIIHLAAQSHVPSAITDPARTLQVNVVGTGNLLQALKNFRFTGRLLYVSSADIYGVVPDAKLPITEDAPPAPRNPYAASKVAAEILCMQSLRSDDLDVVIARPFNHTGPGQSAYFALPGFASDLGAIKLGKRPPELKVGDLSITRDFLDVRDVVAAYLALLARGRSGEIYNVCSSREVRLQDALETLMEMAGIEVRILRDPSRIRPAEQRRMFGSHQKISGDTEWQPQWPLQATLQQLLNHWLEENRK